VTSAYGSIVDTALEIYRSPRTMGLLKQVCPQAD
jgi:hypothetical protein